jgi:hypothetical protein
MQHIFSKRSKIIRAKNHSTFPLLGNIFSQEWSFSKLEIVVVSTSTTIEVTVWRTDFLQVGTEDKLTPPF